MCGWQKGSIYTSVPTLSAASVTDVVAKDAKQNKRS